MRRRLLIALSAACTLTTTACGSSSSSRSSSAGVTGPVVVSAAASLKESFTALAGRFEAAHPGVKVTLNFGGSDSLAAQITGGAAVDVFAAASSKTMATVTDAKDGLGAPVTFVRNELEIAVPPSNPAHVATLADTTRAGVKLVLCAPTVPCGAAATSAYGAANLTAKPVSLEQDVKSVLTKVELNEADAGLVYQTDVKAAGDKVTGIAFPEAAQAIATYPIVAVKSGKNPAAAAAFIGYVLSSTGAAVLSAAGFLKP
ncbi:MAG: molybdate transport system substrate-binding protein [Frankiales bacterium]|nr:molybdate transport system substrate-binding protein [Frankiales bacterium]